MAAAAMMKSQKSRYLRNGLTDLHVAGLCKMGLATAQTANNLNFKNPRWRTAAILKNSKSPQPVIKVKANFHHYDVWIKF